MPPRKRKGGFKKKIKAVAELVGLSSGSSSQTRPPSAPPSPPPRRKNAQPRRLRTPSPSPPPAEDDDEEQWGGEDEEDGEEHGGQDDEDGGQDEEDGGEDLEEDEGLGGMPQELDPTLVWSPPVEEVYVAAEERLEPRDKKPYRRGITKLPKLKTWAFRDVVLVPAGKRYMLILAFHY
jgi:hypothetical protein